MMSAFTYEEVPNGDFERACKDDEPNAHIIKKLRTAIADNPEKELEYMWEVLYVFQKSARQMEDLIMIHVAERLEMQKLLRECEKQGFVIPKHMLKLKKKQKVELL